MEKMNAYSMPTNGELASQLATKYGLETSLAHRIVEDIQIAYADTVEEWVRSRHIRLQRQSLTNEAIYRCIAAELETRRFSAPSLSIRQIRRLIYG